MTLLDRLLGVTPVTQAAAGSPVVAVPVGTAATSEGALSALDPVAAAAFGINLEHSRVSRRDAMRVPGIKRGRNLIASTIGTLPLVASRNGEPVTTGPTAELLAQLDPRTTPAYTIAWTVDDLLFEGVAWWRVTARGANNWPTAIERLQPGRAVVHPTTAERIGFVTVDGKEADDRDLIRFDALDEGLLASDGVDVIRLALALSRASKRVADDDWSGLILRLAEGADELTAEAIATLLDTWETSRRQRTTAYLNRAVDPEKVSVSAADRQLTGLSELVASEVARLLNLPASRIGAPQGSGMTYTNTEGDRRDLVDTTLAPFLTVIAQRLTMPDVTPRGQVTSFDLTAYLRGTTSELVTTGAAAILAGLTDAPEVRTRWLGLPPRDDLPTPQTPAPAAPPTPSPAPAPTQQENNA